MAAKKKKVKKKVIPKGKPRNDRDHYVAFLEALLGGTVNAVRLYESRDASGQLVLEVDEEMDA